MLASEEYTPHIYDLISLFGETADFLMMEILTPYVRIHPLYIAFFVLIGFFFFRAYQSKNPGAKSFLSWMFSKDIYLHPSHMTDIWLFLVSRFFAVVSAGIMTTMASFMALFSMTLLISQFGPTGTGEPTIADIVLITLISTLVGDFCVYWIHRIHHEAPALWPFHSVHHSAEVLTPVTAYRKHPVYDALSSGFISIVMGALQGMLLYFIAGSIEILTLLGANAFYVIFNSTSANFRHSHIWIRFPRMIEHIFISPAQHQVHHSRAPRHHDKNYGEIFALWDWMFGTLYIPDGYEKLEFGLANRDGSPIKQPHGNIKAALLRPFMDSGRELRKRLTSHFRRRT